MKNNDCKIIKDLLPSYIDGLTAVETNEFIKKHLEECNDCRKIYEKIKNETNIENESDKEKIEGLKKVHKKIKILEIIAIIILLTTFCISIKLGTNAKKLLDTLEHAFEMYKVSYVRQPDIFYATIEEITDLENTTRRVEIRGIESNDKETRNKKFVFDVFEGSVPEIMWKGKVVEENELKKGQKLLVYSDRGGLEELTEEISPYRVIILDSEL